MTNQFIVDFIKYKKGLSAKNPFCFNLLKLQQGTIVENSHSNILLQLLQYKDSSRYPFLESLFQRLNISISSYVNVTFRREKNRIDGLVYRKDDFAVIIENKINGATCGKDQLSRYYATILKDNGIFNKTISEIKRKKRIWIVFLTFDGGHPHENDLSELHKVGLVTKCNDEIIESDYYIEANYRSDILPWLEDDVLPNIPRKDEELYTGVYQYIKFFELSKTTKLVDSIQWFKNNVTFVDQSDIVKTNQNLHECLKLIDINNINFSKIDDGSELRNELRSTIYALIEEPMRVFLDVTKEYFQFSGKLHLNYHPTFYYINILYWTKKGLSLSLYWDCLGMNVLANGSKQDYSLNFCFKGADKDCDEAKEIKKIIENNGFCRQAHVINKIVYRKTIKRKDTTPFLRIQEQECQKGMLYKLYKDNIPENLINEINKHFQ